MVRLAWAIALRTTTSCLSPHREKTGQDALPLGSVVRLCSRLGCGSPGERHRKAAFPSFLAGITQGGRKHGQGKTHMIYFTRNHSTYSLCPYQQQHPCCGCRLCLRPVAQKQKGA